MEVQGKLSKEFASLLSLIWNGEYLSIQPIEFKSVLMRYAPQFSDFRQHDAQVRSATAFTSDGCD